MLTIRYRRWLPALLFVFAASGTVLAQGPRSLEQRVAALEARIEIEELILAYGRALDRRDFIAFSNLFAEDVGTWNGGMGIATGRDAIFELMDSTIGHADEPVQPRSHHVMTNIVINVNLVDGGDSVDGDTATATTKWIFVVPSETGDPRWQFLGHYDDEFIRRDGRWYFLRRQAFTDIPVQ